MCRDCLADGVARADAKLLRGSVPEAQMPELVQSVWPEASAKEVAVAAQQLVDLGIAVPVRSASAVTANLEHRLWPLLRQLRSVADPVDPVEYVHDHGASWAAPLITPARLGAAGLHVFARVGTSKVHVRRKTALNAVSKDTLERALRANSIKGTPLESVYREYEAAFKDVFELARLGTVTIDEGMAWHASAVPKATPGAFEAWRRALAAYKPN